MNPVATFLSLLHSLLLLAGGILGIGFVIAFHEFAHFLFCRLFNIAVPSFSIGMGPVIFKKRIGSTDFALSALPIGGYVEPGRHYEDDPASLAIPQDQLFDSKPYYQKMIVIGGGVCFNILFAWIALFVLFLVGMPQSAIFYPDNAHTTVASIVPDSPAAQAGIEPQDVLVAFGAERVGHPVEPLLKMVAAQPHVTTTLTVERKGVLHTLPITLGTRRAAGKEIGMIGINFEQSAYRPMGPMHALYRATWGTGLIMKKTIEGFIGIFKEKELRKSVSGPVMIIAETVKGFGKGPRLFFLILAIISITLAVLNLVPLPILDGGQALMTTIEAVVGRPLHEGVKAYIHYACWIAMLLLTAYLSIKDLIKIFPFLHKISSLWS